MRLLRLFPALLAPLALALPGCGSAPAGDAVPSPRTPANADGPLFEDVTTRAGIDFTHDNGSYGKKLFPEIMGSGGAWFDADGDGYLDLFLVTCETLENPPSPRRPLSRFYRNRGDGTFEDRTASSGLGRVGYGMGCAVGDYDGDGHPDLYVTALGPDRLFRNRGDGTFEDVTRRSGIHAPLFGSSAAFIDYDGDGDLDLYVCNYVQLPTPISHVVCRNPAGGRQYCDVHIYKGQPDQLFRNDGNGTFTDVSKASGIASRAYRGLAVFVLDFNDDGRPDILVANDENPVLLWRNQGDGTFKDVAAEAGVAVDGRGKMIAGMGLDVADLDRDGRPEFVETNFQGQPNILFSLQEGGWFLDRTQEWQFSTPSLDRLAFGLAFLDGDLDGWRDLAIANGHVIDDVQQFQPSISFQQQPQYFRNVAGARLEDRSLLLGSYAAQKRVGRGLLAADYDNDGDTDLLFTNNNQAPALLRGLAADRKLGNWLGVELRGSGPAQPYGAMVSVVAGGIAHSAPYRAAAGYLGSNDPRIQFGLADVQRVERLEVTWPDGTVEEFPGLESNRYQSVRQGSGRRKRERP